MDAEHEEKKKRRRREYRRGKERIGIRLRSHMALNLVDNTVHHHLQAMTYKLRELRGSHSYSFLCVNRSI